MAKLLPLNQFHLSLGAVLGEVDGWLMPLRFAEPSAEVSAVRGGAGLLDLSSTFRLAVSGEDSVGFLHRMLTNDIRQLAVGGGCRAALLEHRGHLISDLRVLRKPDGILLLVPPATGAAVVEFLDRYIIADRVAIRDVTEAGVLLSVQGPHAGDIYLRLTGRSSEGAPRHCHEEFMTETGTVLVIHSDHTGSGGFDVVADAGSASALAGELLCTGEPFGIRPVGREAWNILRVEAGIPWFGIDMTGENLVQEALMEDAVSYSKGCYVGQEIVARVHARGQVNRHLCGFRLEGRQVPVAGDKVLVDGTEAGWVTSGVFSPSLGRPVALGYARREAFRPGHPVTVLSGDVALRGEMAALPLYSPGG